VSCGDARRGTDDPPAFEVRGDLTEVSIRVPLPRPFGVWLRVVDGDGVLVREGLRGSRRRSTTRQMLFRPDWVACRTRRDHEDLGSAWFEAGGLRRTSIGCGGPAATTPCVPSDARGYWLDDNLERARAHWASYDHADSSRVEWHVSDDEVRGRTYLGVVLPIDVLIARVTWPDGRPLARAEARVCARCKAILVDESTPATAWSTLPIHVSVHAAGHEALGFDATAEDPSPRWALMRSTYAGRASER
jgi:hypothetical protein